MTSGQYAVVSGWRRLELVLLVRLVILATDHRPLATAGPARPTAHRPLKKRYLCVESLRDANFVLPERLTEVLPSIQLLY